MNKSILMGRLTRDPEIRYSQNDNSTCVARFSIAVDRKFKRQGEPEADFINCIAFGKTGEFIEKYFFKGMKICLSGRIQTGSYTNKEGQKVYTTDVVAEEVEFAESKAASQQGGNQSGYNPQNASSNVPGVSGGFNQGGGFNVPPSDSPGDGFMNIPDGIDEELPFN